VIGKNEITQQGDILLIFAFLNEQYKVFLLLVSKV